MTEPHFDAAPVLRGLKDFQRRTVEHAFKRLYKGKNPSRRFLVADEVGLGKTLVARGIVAKAIEHLQYSPEIDRIDVVYVCSNAAIAQQNVNRLNVLGLPACALATRLTLLPLELSSFGEQRINFVSFTPGTTFDLKSSTGRREERPPGLGDRLGVARVLLEHRLGIGGVLAVEERFVHRLSLPYYQCETFGLS